jgi:glycosyltransferase involved in cell wall biosynthesis
MHERDGSARSGTVLMTADTMGGVFSYAVTLATALARRGSAVHLATMGERPRCAQRLAAEAAGMVLHESDYRLEWMDDPWDDVIAAGHWLCDLERRIRPNVVHLNGYSHATAGFEAPVVVVAHSCVSSWWEAVLGEAAPRRYDRYRATVQAGLAAADAIVTPSAAMKAALERHYGATGVRVVPNGAAEHVSRRPKEPFVLSCGRLWDRAKNVAAVVRVANKLSWPVRVAGEGGEDFEGVEHLGWLSATALSEVMDRASIFALPARYEPFGLSALEAALHGSALVLGDIASQHEVWGDAALFVPPDDDAALAAAIETLTSDAELRKRLASRAFARALTYSPDRMAEQTLDVYASARGAIRCAS